METFKFSDFSPRWGPMNMSPAELGIWRMSRCQPSEYCSPHPPIPLPKCIVGVGSGSFSEGFPSTFLSDSRFRCCFCIKTSEGIQFRVPLPHLAERSFHHLFVVLGPSLWVLMELSDSDSFPVVGSYSCWGFRFATLPLKMCSLQATTFHFVWLTMWCPLP
jgi:hypothetical protein